MLPADLLLTTATTSYAITVGPGLLETLPERLETLGLKGKIWLISDHQIFPIYGPRLEKLLKAKGYALETFIIPAGEASKNQNQLWELYTWLIAGGVERRDTIVALGGGVVGDLAGFVSATILRGVSFVQIPTTLLAMVDASIGGKTAINHTLGKNLIGAFQQPSLVLADTLTLKTLPLRELRAGWAEVIKHGVIRDAALFSLLEKHASELAGNEANSTFSLPEPLTCEVIRQAAAVKVAIVSADEKEQGERITLNYGHTLGHALEAATGYNTFLHGEAVAIGMHAAAQIAHALGLFTAEDVIRQENLLSSYGLGTTFPSNVTAEELMALTLHDKKVRNKQIRWVLPTKIGAVSVRDDVPEAIIQTVLRARKA
jgi:3-dehydroquinate synthase